MAKKPTRLVMIEQGMDLFAHKGYNGTSMEDIAKCVGVQKATLYSHVASKEKLFKIIFDKIVEEYIVFLDKITGIHEDKPLSVKLHDIFSQYVYYNRSDAGMKFWDRFYYFPPAGLKEYIYERTVDTKGYLQNRLVALIEESGKKGEIECKNAAAVAKAFYYLLIGFVLSTTYEEREIDDEMNDCVSVFVRSLLIKGKKHL